jgi:CheY-like chemotaxis protein
MAPTTAAGPETCQPTAPELAVPVLVVDDEEYLARMFCQALQERGFPAESATRPAQALERVRDGACRILVSDILMPQMSGLELMREARRLRPDLKVIFITGLRNVETAVEALKTGASDFLPKPFDLAVFVSRVRSVARDLCDKSPPATAGAAPAAGGEPAGPGDWPDVPGYYVLRRLGSGAMGHVYQARQAALNRLVAVKLLRTECLARPHYLGRFLREARAAARMNHAHIVRVHDLLRHHGYLCLVMEYFPSRTLNEFVARSGPLPWAKAAWIAVQIADALAHGSARGIVHRDVKPGNILLGNNWHAKLTDFGLAKARTIVSDSDPDGGATRIGAVVGTPAYLSPEQALAMPDVDVRSDIYGLGLCLYFMLEGRNPYCGNVAELVAAQIHQALPELSARSVPPALGQLIRDMTDKNRERRVQSPAQVQHALRRLLGTARKHAPASPPLFPRRGTRFAPTG